MKRHSETNTNMDDARRPKGVTILAKDSFSVIPRDLLELIFHLIPVHPRLSVLSFVCKRWRQAILYTIADLSIECLVPEVVALLPNLTSLDALHIGDAPVALPRLQRFRLEHGDPSLLIGKATALTDLAVAGTGGAMRLMQSIRSSLTRLELHARIASCDEEQWLAFISKTHFPALYELDIRFMELPMFEAAPPIIRPLLQHHASQLTRLYTEFYPYDVAFPRLQELHSSQVLEGSGPPLPAYPRLWLLFSILSSPVAPRLHVVDPASLVHLHVEITKAVPVSAIPLALSPLTNLTSLYLRIDNTSGPDTVSVLSQLTTLSRLRSLVLHPSNRLATTLPGVFSTLRFLKCSKLVSVDAPLLPHLAALDIGQHVVEATRFLSHVKALIRTAPRLRELTLRTDEPLTQTEDLHELGQLLLACEAAGIERVTVLGYESSMVPGCARSLRWLRLCM